MMRCPKWVSAQDIDRWAATPQAKSILPELLRRLVSATVSTKHTKKVDFPSGAEFQRPGYDGTTFVIQGTEFVPEGICFWELGCNVNNAKGKAQDDYAKRLDEHKSRLAKGETENLKEVSYVAVTASDWHGADQWARDRDNEGNFKEVRAYDSNRLEHWLQQAPAVALWLAQEIHGKRDGVIDISDYWANVQAALQRPLPAKALLTDREAVKTTFSNWLDQPSKELAVRAPSAAELVAVFCAWVQALPAEEQSTISSRTIIVEQRETWRALATSLQPLVLIASPRLESDSDLFAEAVRKGHHVLRHADFRNKSATELPMMRRFHLQEVLREAGLTQPEARQLADAAGGNFTILRRRFAKSSERPPSWAEDASLASLLLAAAWKDECKGDKRIVCEFAQKNYSEVQTIVQRWCQISEDAPVRFADGTWEFLSPIDAWELLHTLINSSQMERFETLAIEVLKENDPALDLPPAERYLASVKGKRWQFSHNLRRGIAEILAIGATREQESSIGRNLSFGSRSTRIIQGILPDGCGWKRWASLGELLPLFMEAAPELVLGTIERDVDKPDSELVELLKQEVPGGIAGAAYHSGLLWALETVAWSEKYVQRASLSLAKLAKRDPGGQWANRPAASAAHIFFSWRPQTMALLEQRISILDYLCEKEPEPAWKMILGLFPDAQGAFMDSVKPSFRSWAAGWTGEVSEADSRQFAAALSNFALNCVQKNETLWPDLLNRITRMPEEGAENAIALLERSAKSISPSVRLRLWEDLRKLVQEHKFFEDAWWALRANELNRLRAIAESLRPNDVVATSVHLFDDDGHMEGSKEENFEEKQRRRYQERQRAIRSIWELGKIDTVLELVQKARQPWSVGIALGEEIGDAAEPLVIPSLLINHQKPIAQFSAAFASNRMFRKGLDWAEARPPASWQPEEIATWAINMPFEARTWNWVASKGTAVEEKYWTRTGVLAFSNLDRSASETAVRQLLKFRRTWSALDHLVSATYRTKASFPPEIVCTILEAIQANPEERGLGTMDAHNIQEAFRSLHESANIDTDRVARLEFAFLPFLDRFSRRLPKMLHRQLARDPHFFVDCLKILYHPRNAAEKEKADPNSKEASRAGQIWHLFRDWQTIPGTDDDGVISLAGLRAWVQAARQESKDADRSEVCDLTLGEVFAKAPEDLDHAKPPIAIREIIEECASEPLERGLSMGLHNQRGVYSKSLYEGGKQERDLAAKFRGYAKICSKWPRTAAVLDEAAEDYIRMAILEDERAMARD